MGVIDLASKAIQKYPNEAIFYQSRSNAYVQLDRVDKGLADMETAVRLSPDQPENYLVRGILYGMKGNYEAAFADYDRARNLNKVQSGNMKLAKDIDSVEIDDRTRYVQKLLKQGNWAEAESSADRVLSLNADNPKGYILKAQIQERQGNKKKAEEYKLRGAALAAEQAGEYEAAGAFFGRLGDRDKAIEVLSKAIAKDPNNDKAYSLRGLNYAEAGENEKAVADYTKAIEIVPSVDGYNNRGEIYRRMKEYDKAQADLDKAYSLDPNYPALLDTMGNLAYDKGEYEKAVEWLTKAIEKEPYSESFVSRAKAYRALGKNDLAVEDEKKAAEWKEKEDKEGIVH